MQKLGLLLLTALCLFSSVSEANNQVFRVGPEIEYILNSNEPQIISNMFMWKIKAVCRITSEHEGDPLAFQVIRKTGSFNGISLNTGDSMEVMINTDDKLYITAAPGAQVRLTNKGEKTMIASCSTVTLR